MYMLKTVKIAFGLLAVTLLVGFAINQNMKPKTPNKIIPKTIESEIKTALSFYPDLKNTRIHFIIKPSLKKSFMKAQPTFGSLFTKVENRTYKILISNSFRVEDKVMRINQIPKEVLIGWIGHELGHIVDYENRSGWGLAMFGIRYLFSQSHIREAERAADSYAVSNNMGSYIIKTKNFILNHADFSEQYKNRIKRLYVSPDEILNLVKEHDSIQESLKQ